MDKKKRNKLAALAGILVLAASLVALPRLMQSGDGAYAAQYRNGFAIVPTDWDSTGVAAGSSFLLMAEDEAAAPSLEEAAGSLTVLPETPFRLESHEEGVLIVPEAALSPSSIYTIYYQGTSFAFQTESAFALMGTLPRNETTNVPITTGIEFYMSHEGARVEEVFSIEPEVPGTFERHGNVVVFVPKGGLEERTVYTVSLKEGMGLEGSDKTLEPAYSFAFETGTREDTAFPEPKGHVRFNRILNDFAPGEGILLPASYGFYDEDVSRTLELSIYRYDNGASMAVALEQFNEMPFWSWYGAESFLAGTEGLDEVASTSLELADGRGYPQLVDLGRTLPEGFYLVDAQWEEERLQTFIQVTDLGYAYVEDGDETYFWTHDLETGRPAEGAVVQGSGSSEAVADARGIARLARTEDEAAVLVYRLSHGDSQALALASRWQPYRGTDLGGGSGYWRYLQTDRNLYQPDDTVGFFGFAKPRYSQPDAGEATVELSQGSWFFYESMPFDFPQEALKTMKVPVEDGFYEGQMALPALEPGHYNLNILIDGMLVSSQSFTVEKYVKPDYKLEVDKDKEAVFLGEPITFTAAASFFEGTPVAGLEIGWNFSGLDYEEGRTASNGQGEAALTFTPEYQPGSQGVYNAWFNAYASLPESGQISGGNTTRIFINDIDVDIEAKLDDGQGSIDVAVHSITLDRLNDGTAKDSSDYLAEALEGWNLAGRVLRNEWVRRETGEYYDFINKEVRKQYTWDLETTVYTSFSMTTGADGKAGHGLKLPEEEHVYYTLELDARDQGGRPMKLESWFGRDGGYYPGESQWRELEADKESYGIGEAMTFRWKTDGEALEAESWLFMAAQNGIRELDVEKEASWSRPFAAADVPNIEVLSVAFTGKTYVFSSTATARLDTGEREMAMTLETDKDAYRPGEVMTVNIRTDAPHARINLTLVDEALLALSDQQVDALAYLYQHVPGGIGQTGASHNNQESSWLYGGYRGFDAVAEESAEAGASQSVKGMGGAEIRSEFKDTAYFGTVVLDGEGNGSATIRLPDNITSWRLAAAGISAGLEAGTGFAQTPVSMPFFISATLNSTYLEGDRPQLGLSAYGQGLAPGETVTYLITSEEAGFEASATGKAFERTLVPLWAMEKGPAAIRIEAVSESGLADGLLERILVVDTYHKAIRTKDYALVPGLEPEAGTEGMATLTFLDEGRAKHLPALYSLAYGEGRRIDQKLAAQIARRMLVEDFKQPLEPGEVSAVDYMAPDGGLAILPYGPSDLEMTALIAELLAEDVPRDRLRAYLASAYYTGADKSTALYGLTSLGEPMLQAMNQQLGVENRSLADTLYLALAYEAIGDTYMAELLYRDHVAELMEDYDKTARIGSDNSDDTIRHTALALVLASRLELEEAGRLYAYALDHTSKEKLTSLERLLAIRAFMEKAETGALQVVYTYDGKEETIDTSLAGVAVKTVPAAMLDGFKVLSVEGDGVLAVSMERPLASLHGSDPNLSATRVYEDYASGRPSGVFESGDIVKVVLDVDIAEGAIDSYYRVVDHAPSGIVPLTGGNAWGIDDERGWYREVEGQRVVFYMGRDWKEQTPLYYYARIISPGTFKGDGVLVQGTQFHDSLWIGQPQTIEIR